MIYERFGNVVEIVAVGTLDDVRKLEGRKPDALDRAAVKSGSYVVVESSEGRRWLYHLAHLRADDGLREIQQAIAAL